MAFVLGNWSQIGVSTNTGGPAMYAYISTTDNQTVTSTANYFQQQAPFLNVGDAIYIQSSDQANLFSVTAVSDTVFPYSVTITNDSFNTNPELIQVANLTVSSADILGMYDTPIPLLSASTLGANFIIVDKAIFFYSYNTTPYVVGGDLVIQYGYAPNGAGPAASVNTAGTGVLDQYTDVLAWSPGSFISPIGASAVAQQDICLSNLTAAYSAGDGQLTILIWYQYV